MKKAEELTVEDDEVAGSCTGPSASEAGMDTFADCCVSGLIPVGRSGSLVNSGSVSKRVVSRC